MRRLSPLTTTRSLQLLLLLTLWVHYSSAAADCSPYPISARLGNVTLSNRQVARGIALTVGNPQQTFALLPQWPLNNTLLYGTDGKCVIGTTPWTQAGCTTFRGGEYDMLSSQTRKTPDPGSFPSDNAPYPQVTMISDSFKLNDNVTLDRFPMGIALSNWGEQGYHPMMAFGLGSNSTLLNTLKTIGKIASRSWGMFYGRTGAAANAQLDGSMVFGGYDRAKVSGSPMSGDLTYNQACPTQMIVSITDMVLNFRNGTDTSIFPKALSTSLTACIVPDYPVLMTLPIDPYFENFELYTGSQITGRSFGLSFFSMRYGSDQKPYDGDLTIKIGGFDARIPNDQLVVPDRTIDTRTGEIIANKTDPNLVINSIQGVNANDMVQLGRQFLSAVYLMANYDTGKFQMWTANPTNDQELVAVTEKGIEVTDNFCAANKTPADSGAGANAGGQTDSRTGTPVEKSKGLSSSAIAGIVIGILAILVLSGIAAWFILKRRKAAVAGSQAPSRTSPHYDSLPSQNKDVQMQVYPKPELPGSSPYPYSHELAPQGPGSQSNYRYELA